MSNNKQSSVQQFWDKIALKLSVDQITEFLPLLEQAKEMENEQADKKIKDLESRLFNCSKDNADLMAKIQIK